MSGASVVFLLLGAAVGTLHVSLLARSARRPRAPVGGVARVLLVGATLVVAARAGHLAAATLGWLLGALGNGARAYRSLR